jgi:hypothetical protein
MISLESLAGLAGTVASLFAVVWTFLMLPRFKENQKIRNRIFILIVLIGIAMAGSAVATYIVALKRTKIPDVTTPLPLTPPATRDRKVSISRAGQGTISVSVPAEAGWKIIQAEFKDSGSTYVQNVRVAVQQSGQVALVTCRAAPRSGWIPIKSLLKGSVILHEEEIRGTSN